MHLVTRPAVLATFMQSVELLAMLAHAPGHNSNLVGCTLCDIVVSHHV